MSTNEQPMFPDACSLCDGAFDVVTVTLNPAIDCTLTIPNFTPGRVNRVEQLRSNPGGKGVNVASALAGTGHRVAATGFLGRENRSDFENLFTQKRIADRFIEVEGQTRTGFKITDPASHQTTDINLPGLAPAREHLDALFSQITELARTSTSWFVLSGSLPPGLPPQTYRDLVKLLKDQGRKVLLDTSGEPLKWGIEAAPQIIKPNLDELEHLAGRPLSSIDAVLKSARSLLQTGIQMVVISMGENGACFVTRESVLMARPPLLKVQSTVGAGDAMAAGIVAAQLRDNPLPACARLATAFSLEWLSGARATIDSMSAVENWIDQVAIEADWRDS